MNGRRIPPPPTLYGGPRQVQRQAAPPARPAPAVRHSPAPVPPAAGKRHAPPPIRSGPPGIQMKAAAGPAQPRIRHSPPAGGAVLQRASEEMKTSEEPRKLVHVKLGANQSETHHIVPADRAALPDRGKFEHLYAGGEGERRKRSFSGERPRQILRWIATVLFAHFPEGVEIQCYWDAANSVLLISSNKVSVNKKIKAALANGIGQFEATQRAGQYEEGRTSRHARKLLVRAKHDGQADIYDALKNNRVLVPEEKLTLNGKPVDVHAERRIQRALGKPLDPACLAGVKRPCLVCASALGIISRSHPGPSWNSTPALFGYDLEDVLNHAVANGVITHVTRDRFTGSLDTGHGTDSESDDDK